MAKKCKNCGHDKEDHKSFHTGKNKIVYHSCFKRIKVRKTTMCCECLKYVEEDF